MTVRFLADEDLDAGIIQGLLRVAPQADILDVKSTGLRGTPDPEILAIAAREGRIVLTHDRNTMTAHAVDRLTAGLMMPGLFVISQRAELGDVIDSLLLVWSASAANEWDGRFVFVPIR
ncbi:MAG: hypothetical protein FJW38_15435 [Acidobacteria bacterium]|nr:hypothetical protein [Acidobacteriota bacterium]